MQVERGILHLSDPLDGKTGGHGCLSTGEMTLVFNENERYLSQAQQALWEMRRRCSWICVSARGRAAAIAIALAAQLPVDRLALGSFRLFAPEAVHLPRELVRIRSFARRNLPLVASRVLLMEADAGEARRLVRMLGGREVCILENWDAGALIAPWPQLCEKNLLNPGKCV